MLEIRNVKSSSDRVNVLGFEKKDGSKRPTSLYEKHCGSGHALYCYP